jgi:flagellin
MNIGSSFNTQNINYINQNKADTEQILEKIAATNELNGTDGAQTVIASGLATQVSEATQNVQNENNSIAMYQIADSSLRSVYDNAQRLNELSISYTNGALNQTQKDMLTEEFDAIKESMQDILETTSYNGGSLMSGELELDGISELDITDIQSIDSFMGELDTLSANIGANINQSEVSIANSLAALSSATSAYGQTSETPLDTKIETLSTSQIQLQSSIITQSYQNNIAQQRVSALLM